MELLDALQTHFGHTSFRGPQEEIVRHVLAGGDALVVMPTGDGKSLCWQLPALLDDGLTLVVSPLIALMEDQVAGLQRRGLAAACVHSQVERDDRDARIDDAVAGRVRLLYVTPERFRVAGFLDRIRTARIVRFVVDEAHCVSQWGHDFRPDYGRLGEVRAALGDPPCVATTATATPAVQQDIVRVLRIPDARVFHTGIERPNLFLAVTECDDDAAKHARLTAALREIGGPGIVYFALIRDLLRVEGELRRAGYAPLVYHGDLSASERAQQQARFLASTDGVVLATNAFGMGVDKPDIRFLVHWQIPRTLEAYVQEIGRAGRDGQASVCELLFATEDLQIQRDFAEWANPGLDLLRGVVQHLATLGDRLHAEDLDSLRARFLGKNRHDGRIETCLRLLEVAGCTSGALGRDFRWLRTPDERELVELVPTGKRERDLQGLLQMARYAGLPECRRARIHAYFGLDDDTSGCGACDVCADATQWLEVRRPAATRRAVPLATATSDELSRGDWIQVRGLGPCTVLSVQRTSRGTQAVVERSDDLSRRTIDLGRTRWTRLRPDEPTDAR